MDNRRRATSRLARGLRGADTAIDADTPVPDRLHDGIRLDHVSFRYPETDRLVLEDVNLDLAAGSVVALVGENGAGKTTLVKLLCRFYEPTEGRITVDGVDLSRLRARRVARPVVRRVPGLLPVRVRGPAQHRCR